MSSEQKPGVLERMFSGIGHVSDVLPAHPPRPADEPFRPLRQSKAGAGVTYRLQSRTPAQRVQASSPAAEVMTDLSRVAAVTIGAGASVDKAHDAMIKHGVRSLFVADEETIILGIITANDISGEKPIQFAQDRGVRHADILVSDVMTPAGLLEAMELQDVLQVRVGDVVETLKRSGRQHALVIESGAAGGPSATRTVRGIFSLTQIARQLGLPPHVGHDVARTFAEIEAAIGA
ncbi:MAG TPA: CBS domain-containing protein [Casimicrobiaceae bacterium]|nr:CBS domain-containing protein [Casimicrobiaceae bacterium]